MPDAQHRLAPELTCPGGNGFVVGDHQVVGFDIELPHIANELPIVIGHDGLSVSKPAGFCDKGQSGTMLEVPERLHVKQALSRSTRKQPRDVNIRMLFEGVSHGAGSADMTLSRRLDPIENAQVAFPRAGRVVRRPSWRSHYPSLRPQRCRPGNARPIKPVTAQHRMPTHRGLRRGRQR